MGRRGVSVAAECVTLSSGNTFPIVGGATTRHCTAVGVECMQGAKLCQDRQRSNFSLKCWAHSLAPAFPSLVARSHPYPLTLHIHEPTRVAIGTLTLRLRRRVRYAWTSLERSSHFHSVPERPAQAKMATRLAKPSWCALPRSLWYMYRLAFRGPHFHSSE